MHVVQLFEHVEQLLHFRGIVAGQFDGVLGAHGHFGHFRRQTRGFQRIFHRLEIGRCSQHLDGAVVARDDIFGARLQGHFHHRVFSRARRKNQLATVLELEYHRAFGAHAAAMLAERMAHFGHGANAVVGHGVNDDGRATNAVALVADFLIGQAFGVACGLVDVVFDAVRRHVGCLGLVHRQAQTGVGRQIATTRARGHGDFANDAGPDLAAFFILPSLSVLDIRPFTVSCHGKSFCIDLIY